MPNTHEFALLRGENKGVLRIDSRTFPPMIRNVGLLSMCALLGCAARPTPQTATVTRTATVTAAPEEAWSAAYVPELHSYTRATNAEDGSILTHFGSARVRVLENSVEYAQDFPTHNIIATVRENNQWLFLTSDGTLFRSDSFIGPLTRVAESRRSPLLAFQGSNRINFIDPAGTLSLGRSNATEFSLAPINLPVIAAGFADTQFGLAVSLGGTLHRTSNGGQSFDRVDLGEAAALWITPTGNTFAVQTSAGWSSVDRNGTITPLADTPESTPTQIPRARMPSLVTELEAHFLYGAETAILEDERLVFRDGTGVSLRSAPGGEASEPVEIEAPTQGSCEYKAWGANLLASCYHQQRTALYRWNPGQGWAMLREFSGAHQVLTGNDGLGLVMNTSCEESARRSDRHVVCIFDGVEWRSRVVPRQANLIAVRAEGLLFAEDTDESYEAQVPEMRFLSRNRERPRPIALDNPDADLQFASFTHDGGIVGIARDGEQRFVAVGVPGAPMLSLRPLPTGALEVSFLNEQRGIAAGATLDALWTTTDGGRTWTPLRVPVRGSLSNVRLHGTRSLSEFYGGPRPPFVQCRSRACTVAGRVVWAPSAMLTALTQNRTIHAAENPPSLNLEDRSPPRAPNRTYRCELTDAPAPARRGEVLLSAPAGTMYLEERRGNQVAFRWSGIDERGRFQAASRSTALPEATPSPSSVWLPRLLTRELSIVERCNDEGHERVCELIVAQHNGNARSIGTIPTLLRSRRSPWSLGVVGALPLPHGAAVLLGRTSFISEGAVDLLLVFDQQGALQQSKYYTWGDSQGFRSLATDASGPGVLFVRSTDREQQNQPATFFPIRANATPRTMQALAPEAMPPFCTEATPNALLVAIGTSYSSFSFGLSLQNRGTTQSFHWYGRGIRTLLQWNDNAICIREHTVWPDADNSQRNNIVMQLRTVPVLRATADGIAGSLVGTPTELSLPCDYRE